MSATHAIISMTMMRPVSRGGSRIAVTAAGVHPTARDDGDADVAQALHLAVGEGQSRATVIESYPCARRPGSTPD